MHPLATCAILLIFLSCSTENPPPVSKYDPALDFPKIAWYQDAGFKQRILPRIESDLPLSENFDYACTNLPNPRWGILKHTNGALNDSFSVDPSGVPSIDLSAFYATETPCECRNSANRYSNIGFCLQSARSDTFHCYNSEIDTVLVSPFCLGRIPWGEEIGLWVVRDSDSLFYSIEKINGHDDYFTFPK